MKKRIGFVSSDKPEAKKSLQVLKKSCEMKKSPK